MHKAIDNEKSEWAVFIHGLGGNSLIFKKQLDDFSKEYNLLLIDMHGHGNSKNIALSTRENPSFKYIAKDILKVLDFLGIHKAHFIGISLGTMIIPAVAEIAPHRITSMILGGAVVRYPLMAKFLILLGNKLKGIIPYMNLYSFFAWIIMPRKNHRKSRSIFVREAAKLGSREFLAWFSLMQRFEKDYPLDFLLNINIPKLYIMGNEDHMLLSCIKHYVEIDSKAKLHIIPDCGHVCNIDSTAEFNSLSLDFLNRYSMGEDYELQTHIAG